MENDLKKQNPTFSNYVIGFINRAQRFTGSNYLDVDSPFKKITFHMDYKHLSFPLGELGRILELAFCQPRILKLNALENSLKIPLT